MMDKDDMNVSVPIRMSAASLIVRCVAEPRDDQWQAFTLELGLAAQADTLVEAQAKLHEMIACYLEDALVGEDRPYARSLLARRAAPSIYLKYYAYKLLAKFGRQHERDRPRVFDEPMALSPFACVA